MAIRRCNAENPSITTKKNNQNSHWVKIRGLVLSNTDSHCQSEAGISVKIWFI